MGRPADPRHRDGAHRRRRDRAGCGRRRRRCGACRAAGDDAGRRPQRARLARCGVRRRHRRDPAVSRRQGHRQRDRTQRPARGGARRRRCDPRLHRQHPALHALFGGAGLCAGLAKPDELCRRARQGRARSRGGRGRDHAPDRAAGADQRRIRPRRHRLHHRAHRHSDQFRHHGRARLHRWHRHRRADVQPVHPRQHPPVRRAEGDRRVERHDPPHGRGAGGADRPHRLWLRHRARGAVRQFGRGVEPGFQGLLHAVADPGDRRRHGAGDDLPDRSCVAARRAQGRSGGGVPVSAAIRIEGVVKEFPVGDGIVRVLHGVDAELRSGELTYLVGESGSGKTTLISVIAGILRPTAGRVTVLGEDIYSLGDNALVAFRLRSIGFIFQQYNLLPTLTAAENASVPLVAAGVARAEAIDRARALLDKLGMASQADKLPRQMSGGQQQRVAIARALVHEPRLVVCDEPTAALDARSGRRVMDLLREVALAQDRTVIVVTHDNRIFDLADRILAME
ncbi:MAG: ABC transporter ATP-binding protein, partial [Alphaproteobacteria bacterium]|nr:ABC transporter ATP-binding protein [Alphaproteobacteria bacterium]